MSSQFLINEIKATIKSLLKNKKMSYQQVANHLNCSLSTVKRILGKEELALSRLLEICELLGLSMGELEKLAGDRKKKEILNFTISQEEFFADNPEYFNYYQLLHSGKSPKQIAKSNKLNKLSSDKYLRELENIGVITISPKGKISFKYKSSPDWIERGPLMQAFYRHIINSARDYFLSRITHNLHVDPLGDEELMVRFHILDASNNTLKDFLKSLQKLINELDTKAGMEAKYLPKKDLAAGVLYVGFDITKDQKQINNIMDNSLGKIANIYKE